MPQRLSPGRQLFIQIVIGYAVMFPVSWLGIFGMLAGIAAMAASMVLGKYGPEVIEGVTYTLFNVDTPLMLTGWMLLAFFSTHTWFARPGRPPHGTSVQELPTRK